MMGVRFIIFLDIKGQVTSLARYHIKALLPFQRTTGTMPKILASTMN